MRAAVTGAGGGAGMFGYAAAKTRGLRISIALMRALMAPHIRKNLRIATVYPRGWYIFSCGFGGTGECSGKCSGRCGWPYVRSTSSGEVLSEVRKRGARLGIQVQLRERLRREVRL